MAISRQASAPVFHHIGLLHDSPASYTRGCVTFIREGLDAGAPVLVAVPGGGKNEAIRDALGDADHRLQFADMSIAGRNPGRILPWILLEFADRHPGQRVWLISESMWPDRSCMEYQECAAHDAMINLAFTGRDAAILCPFDTVALRPQTIADAHRTHPTLADGVNTWRNSAYADPVDAARDFDLPIPHPPGDAYRCSVADRGDLRGLRQTVTAQATAANVAPQRVRQLAIAVNELACNSILHADGHASLSLWSEPGVFVCQIDDAGTWPDPMAGRVPRPAGSTGGYGLLIVHELADLVRVHSHQTGTSIRLHINLPNQR
ncbi:anti-sigma regulatory factor [Rhizocola hellebori]|uniref:Anti-sigma regulatory factor n=1 Tax=Rhizocola hellebori TaxID=1392758 RepID=A0A8J3QDD6_9ACTN|nr:sensor histidine kinase [Rhizocola hellebori]GIH07982.1 anti-sigma regulatory factor [Rhizocola hellebori]